MINLIGNAIKFQESGIIYIRLSSHDNNLLIEILDSGSGIPEKKYFYIIYFILACHSSAKNTLLLMIKITIMPME